MEDYKDENSDEDMVSAVVQYLSSNEKPTDEELADPLLYWKNSKCVALANQSCPHFSDSECMIGSLQRHVFSARQHICYSALFAIARPSVCLSVCLSVPLSVTRVDQSKTVEVRITQPSPQSSPMTLVS